MVTSCCLLFVMSFCLLVSFPFFSKGLGYQMERSYLDRTSLWFLLFNCKIFKQCISLVNFLFTFFRLTRIFCFSHSHSVYVASFIRCACLSDCLCGDSLNNLCVCIWSSSLLVNAINLISLSWVFHVRQSDVHFCTCECCTLNIWSSVMEHFPFWVMQTCTKERSNRWECFFLLLISGSFSSAH